MKKLIIIVLSFFILSACKNPDKIREDIIIKNRIRTDNDSLTQAYLTREKKDVVRGLYPSSRNLPFSALITGTLHQNEASREMEDMKWFGIFKSKDRYYIASTIVVVRPCYDPIVDESRNDASTWTGWQVSTINIDDALILINNNSDLYLGNIKYDPMLQGMVIRTGGVIDFDFNSVKYKLYAEGEEINAEWNPEEKVVHNYRLYIQAAVNGKNRTQLLAATPFLDDAEFEIMFVGDIDNDGAVDMIINTHDHYNIYRPTLYLSSFAGESELLRPVALHESIAY